MQVKTKARFRRRKTFPVDVAVVVDGVTPAGAVDVAVVEVRAACVAEGDPLPQVYSSIPQVLICDPQDPGARLGRSPNSLKPK